MLEYSFIAIIIILSCVLAILLLLVSYMGIPKNYDNEKVSPYECGFDPFSDTRTHFEIRYCLVAILFILFDLEVVFIFPWAVSIQYTGKFGILIMFIFLSILLLGFAYEWIKGALDWE